MRRGLIAVLALVFAVSIPARAQQVPFLSELLSRYEEFNRIYAEKRRAGENLAVIALARKRCEEALKRGDIPGVLEAIGEARAVITGKKWDERQKFISSLTVETDRLVIEPNQILQVTLTRMFPAAVDKTFTSPLTVTFAIISGEVVSDSAEAPSILKLWRTRTGSLPAGVQEPVIIAENLAVGETSSNATRKLLLPDGPYQVVALIESGGKEVAEIKRQVYAISDFRDSINQLSRSVAAIRRSNDAKVKAVASLAAAPEFQLNRLSQLTRSRGEVEINPLSEIDRLEQTVSALAKGENPFSQERGEIEGAYQAAEGTLVPYRLYVPQSYDGTKPVALVVMTHGALGDERYYFSGLLDPAVIKAEADRRGWILAGANGRGRFGASTDDVFEVISSVSRDYNIDPSRIYLTGHSIGGAAVWLAAASKPELFAAIAPVSGGPPAQGDALKTLLSKLTGTPVTVVHGAQDVIAPVQLSRTMVSSAEKAGVKVNYVEVPDGDHLSVVASTFPAIAEFFEKHQKGKK